MHTQECLLQGLAASGEANDSPICNGKSAFFPPPSCKILGLDQQKEMMGLAHETVLTGLTHEHMLMDVVRVFILEGLADDLAVRRQQIHCHVWCRLFATDNDLCLRLSGIILGLWPAVMW